MMENTTRQEYHSLRKESISVVIPVFKCTECLFELVTRLKSTLIPICHNYEVILVDDGCPQFAWPEILRISKELTFVKGIKLSRNFGQHSAIIAGLENSIGEWVVIMDCDLQDCPEEITKLANATVEDVKIVRARRHVRWDSMLKKVTSKLFYKALGFLAGAPLDPACANFGIYHRDAIKALLCMKESTKFFPVMIQWVGFKVAYVDVEHQKRTVGSSSYSLIRLMNLALDIIISFSNKPLRIAVLIGLFTSILSGALAIYILILAFLGKFTILGWPSLMLSVWFLTGLMLFFLGLIGIYIGRVFDEVKSRPIYIIEKSTDR